MRDIFSFVKQEDECVLYSYTNTAKRLKKEGAAQFLLPGSAAGLFLVLLGILLPHLFSASTGSVFFWCAELFRRDDTVFFLDNICNVFAQRTAGRGILAVYHDAVFGFG